MAVAMRPMLTAFRLALSAAHLGGVAIEHKSTRLAFVTRRPIRAPRPAPTHPQLIVRSAQAYSFVTTPTNVQIAQPNSHAGSSQQKPFRVRKERKKYVKALSALARIAELLDVVQKSILTDWLRKSV